MDKGFISIHRKIREHWIWQREDYLKAWIDLLMMVNHKEKKILFNSQLIKVKRGERITSLRKISERWGWSTTKLKRFFDLLVEDEMLSYKSDKEKTFIKVLNYNVYQYSDSDENNSKKTLKKQSSNTKKTQGKHKENSKVTLTKTNNNGNNGNNENNENKYNNNNYSELAKIYQKLGFRSNGYTADWLSEILDRYGFTWCKNALEISDKNNVHNKAYVESILNNWDNNGGMKLKKEPEVPEQEDYEIDIDFVD